MGQSVDHPVGKLHDGREAYVRVDPDGNATAGPAQLPCVGVGAPGEQFPLAGHQRRPVFQRVALRIA